MTAQADEAAALTVLARDVAPKAQPLITRLGALSAGGWLLAVTAIGGCAFAFVGLVTSSFWTDELFTLFVIGHRGGPAEVLRRALTDTHPPLYYLLLYGWSHLFGLGETALRSLSALMAVGAVAVSVCAARGVFTREGRAFGAAVAATSPLWFYQAQNIRNYSLCFLLAAVMLWLAVALRRRVRAKASFPFGLWAALTATALLDALSHFYGLLVAGALLAALMATLPGWRLRGAFAASGLLILTIDGVYAHVLAAHTHEDWGHLWFSRDPETLLAVPNEAWEAAVGWAARWAVLMLLGAWAVGRLIKQRRAPMAVHHGLVAGEAAWLAGVCAFVLVAVYVAGVAETLLFAPTLSDQNVLTAAPAAWVLLAALYDAALRRLGARWAMALSVVVGLLLLAHGAAIARGRWLPRNEEWRASAAYVETAPGCAGATIPVLQPGRFGPDTPFYREIARRWLFGHYLGDGGTRVQPHLREALEHPGAPLAVQLAKRAHDPSACAVLVWAVHDVTTEQAVQLQRAITDEPGMIGVPVTLHSFPRRHFKREAWVSQPSAFVIERGHF